jgi:hypothetical protein
MIIATRSNGSANTCDDGDDRRADKRILRRSAAYSFYSLAQQGQRAMTDKPPVGCSDGFFE